MLFFVAGTAKIQLWGNASIGRAPYFFYRLVVILNILSEEYPDDIPAKLQLALCYETISLYVKSINCYDQLLMIDSTNTYFEVRKADLLYRSERYASALHAYSQIDSTYNPNYIARCMGMCYEKLNQTDAAKQHFSKAWELNDSDAYSASSLVKLQIKDEDYVSAFQNSESFIEKDSTNSTMNALNAFVYYNLEYFDIAIERFEKCLSQGDSSLLVNRSLGFAYYLTDNFPPSLPLLQQAFLQDTTNLNVLFILGRVNYKLQNYPEAIECYVKVLEKTYETIPTNMTFYKLYNELAMAYENNDEIDSAVENYIRSIEYASPDDNSKKMALYYKIATLRDEKLNDYKDAMYYYERYRVTLLNYRKSLKDEQEIAEIESKLTALDEYIIQLTEKTIEQE